MERNKKTSLLFLLLSLVVVSAENCPNFSDNKALRNLTCESDFDDTITCVWNSTSDGVHVSKHPDSVCTIHAKFEHYGGYHGSCDLKPVEVSKPTLQKCSVIFKRKGNFMSEDNVSISLSCNTMKQKLTIFFMPACHIKLNPPPQPDVNFTTVTWNTQKAMLTKIESYFSQLQWKQKDQSWSYKYLQEEVKPCSWNCMAELNPDKLIKGERYEARVRVKADTSWTKSVWSDWSPTTTWVSLEGEPKPQSADFTGVWIAVAAAFAVIVVVIQLKSNKTTWVYIVKKITGPPLPSPVNFFPEDANFPKRLSPHFTSESFYSVFKPVEIVSVEVTSTVDAVEPCGPEVALLEKMRSELNHRSTSSNYSNPSYSRLCPPPPPLPPVSSLTAGDLLPCAADTPYGPVVSQSEGKNAEQDRHEVKGKEVEIHQLLSKGSNNSKPVLVISDYEKVEKVQVERSRLRSLDSGVCSGEEVSQESLEADSINMTDCHDEGPKGEGETLAGNGKDIDFQKLFRGGGDVFGKGIIHVCSGYEQVQQLPADSPELASLDSGISSGGEEQVSQEESVEDVDKSTESTSLLPPPFSTSPCSLPCFTQLPLNFCGPGLSPALQSLPSHLLQKTAPMPTNRSMEPSGDGYMPVRQEQS
ncbi:uncharacterized protein LOC121941886 isoform X2 [Plectropomus leopardus]|uniref:uncharacterized protein LOC121941886 isoform X2 n=1 Tax=Plectropomus leopardus TaxID=160734 RepID=UPI001C4D6CEF|nr:uncharacterized protein LOC121941886 isoform X2 [Plectropomus leopardus]